MQKRSPVGWGPSNENKTEKSFKNESKKCVAKTSYQQRHDLDEPDTVIQVETHIRSSIIIHVFCF